VFALLCSVGPISTPKLSVYLVLSKIMARGGTQNKSGPDHASPNWHNATDGDVLSTPKKVAADGENPSSHVQGRSKVSEGSSNKKAKGSKKNSRWNSISSSGKPDGRASYKQQQMDGSFDISSSEENDFPSRPTKSKNGSKKFSRRGSGKKVPIEKISLPGFAENVLEKTRCMACIAASIFSASMMYVVEETKRYIDRKRPTIDAFMAMVNKGHGYAFSKIKFVYPIVRSWMLNAGRLVLLFLAVWLDCNRRGFDSLLRPGTNYLLVVLWCSMLSIFAMIGIKKMLVVMVLFCLSPQVLIT
jgi:DnaJ homolog subfamily C member 14